MKQISYILTGVFLTGIILMGIGAGVAFWEYSSFQYVGERLIGNEKNQTRTMEYKIPKTKEKKKILLRQCMEETHILVKDKKVPEDVILYDVTYNSEYVEPVLYYNKMSEDEYRGELYLSGHNKKSDVEILLENKDRILNDLKNKKIAFYQYGEQIKKIKIRVNPNTMNKVESEKSY